VATLGTATTPTHIQKLLRASDKIIFSFDGDSAGRRAAWRALQACLPLLRDDISIRFLFLPTEHDPDSYIREFGEEAFRASLKESDALSTFFLNELASRHAIKEVEGRSALVHEARPLLAQVPAITLKIQLQNELARLVQLTPEELSQLMAQLPPPTMAGLPDANGFRAGADRSGSAQGNRSVDQASRGQEPGAYESSLGEPQSGRPVFGARSSGRTPGVSSAGTSRRSVTPLARRLLRLFLTHPELIDDLGDQQLEILHRGPNLEMVRDLIVLAQSTGARHVGALIQVADPGADLGVLLASVAADLMAQETLPNPQAEWEDAVRRIELESLKAEQEALIADGLNNLQSQQNYQELSGRISRLIKVIESVKAN
jgi:DNA primase